MNKVDPKVAIDLGKLALARCDQAFASVAQLLEEGPDVYALTVLLAAHFIEYASHDLQDGMDKQNGRRPPYETCLHHTISEVLNALQVEHDLVEKIK